MQSNMSGILERAEDINQLKTQMDAFIGSQIQSNIDRDDREAALANENRKMHKLLDEFKTTQSIYSFGEFQGIKTQVESLSNLPSFSHDPILLEKMATATDIHCRDRMAYHALTKADPDIAAAKKFLGEGLRLSENYLIGGNASLQTPKDRQVKGESLQWY